MSGKKRQVLALEGKRAKLHCDCGMKIFEAGMYVVFEMVPRSSVSVAGYSATTANNRASSAFSHSRTDSGMGRRMYVD